ncbi:MAG: ABC transporter permease [Candidatus Cloacimonetes bacterium]|jgi:ABC-type lipoprotein release transport system permease subunit|nr:ABC transporter permease [Candidatus Cloacimonadota bacterium]
MIFKLALRNILNNGWRSLINILILSIVLIIIIWMQATYHSWITQAEIQQGLWEYGEGILRARNYDPFDPLSFDESHAKIPSEYQTGILEGDLIPILLSPASIYPQMRMQAAVLKGIPQNQDVVVFPSEKLDHEEGDLVPVLIGQVMAKSSRLQEGDIFTIRVREITGSFNAIDAIVKEVLQIPAPSADIGTIWMDFDLLQKLRNAPDMASYFVMRNSKYFGKETEDFRFVDRNEYFADLYEMMDASSLQQTTIYGLLVFLAMLSIFDTQALAVFRRRKEIGTLSAMGLTKGKIISLFTLEGVLYTAFAIFLTPILGFPLFWYFATKGFPVLEGFDSFGLPGFVEPIMYEYPIGEILVIFAVILVLTAFVSWLPARKISKLDPVDALRGKVD